MPAPAAAIPVETCPDGGRGAARQVMTSRERCGASWVDVLLQRSQRRQALMLASVGR